MNIDKEVLYGAKDFPTQKNPKVEKSSTSSNYQILDDDKKLDSTISRLTENPGNPKPETMTYKICGIIFCNYTSFNIVYLNWKQKI